MQDVEIEICGEMTQGVEMQDNKPPVQSTMSLCYYTSTLEKALRPYFELNQVLKCDSYIQSMVQNLCRI